MEYIYVRLALMDCAEQFSNVAILILTPPAVHEGPHRFSVDGDMTRSVLFKDHRGCYEETGEAAAPRKTCKQRIKGQLRTG